jgi:hypothetical protein
MTNAEMTKRDHDIEARRLRPASLTIVLDTSIAHRKSPPSEPGGLYDHKKTPTGRTGCVCTDPG